jgi:hypothetical protein
MDTELWEMVHDKNMPFKTAVVVGSTKSGRR